MGIPSVKIVISGVGSGQGNGIEVDGVCIPGTHTIAFCNKVGEPSTVLVGLWAREIIAEIEGAQVILTPEHVRSLIDRPTEADVTEIGQQFREYTSIPEVDVQAIASRVADILGRRAAVRAKL